MAAAWPAGLRATRRTAACLNGGGRTRLDGRANNRDRGRSARRRLGRPNWREEDVRGCGRRRKSPWGGLVRACHCGFRSMTGRLHGEATKGDKGACGQGGKQSDEATKGAGCLHLHGLTGGIGAPGLNTSIGLPAASMFVAPMAAAPLMQPVGVVPGEPLPIISQSADIGTPTEFLLLKNMFDPAVETDPDFDLDITDDVQDECSKFGVVKHIFVDKRTAGFVYLHFDSATAATSAQRSLHGRWFAGWILLKRREVERHQ